MRVRWCSSWKCSLPNWSQWACFEYIMTRWESNGPEYCGELFCTVLWWSLCRAGIIIVNNMFLPHIIRPPSYMPPRRLLVLDICHLLFEKARERRRWVSSDYKIGWGHIDRGGGPEESEGGTYAILIVPNRLLSHRHLHHMGRNYPLSMDGASYHRTVAAKTLPLYQLCNLVGQNTERWRLLRYCLHIADRSS